MSLLDDYEASLNITAPQSLLELVEQQRQVHVLNESAFTDFTSQHRPHQVQAITAISQHSEGQIIIPTGTGKTRVQVHVHVEDMIAKTNAGQFGVYVIGAHRLLLCMQLMDELRDICIKCGLPINVLYIGSARQDDKEVYDQYFELGIDKDTFESTYTTNTDEVKAFYDKTVSQHRHLVIVATYHSFDKLLPISSIDICTYDEAHVTVSATTEDSHFMEHIRAVKPLIRRNYFFTATRKVRSDIVDGGMDDTAIYGSVIATVFARDMIDAGEIVMPKIHIVQLSENDSIVSDTNERMLVKTVMESFEEHRNRLKEDSAQPDLIEPKLLVTCKGSEEINLLQNNDTFKQWCISQNIKVFSFSSRYGCFVDFSLDSSRNRVYENMQSLNETDKCILLHIDILTEGIDLPSITAVMLLRHLNTIKLLQSMGRALRLLKADRNSLYSGSMQPSERDRYVKPYAYMILPMHFESLNASVEDMKDMLRKVLTEYNMPVEEFLPLEKFGKVFSGYLDPVTNSKEKNKREREYPLIHLIQEFVLEDFQNGLPADPDVRYLYLIEQLSRIIGGLNA